MCRPFPSLLLFLSVGPFAVASPDGGPSSADRTVAAPVAATWDANAWEPGSGSSFWRKRPEVARPRIPASTESASPTPRRADASRAPRSDAGSGK